MKRYCIPCSQIRKFNTGKTRIVLKMTHRFSSILTEITVGFFLHFILHGIPQADSKIFVFQGKNLKICLFKAKVIENS